jgi:hypothetical protein
MRRGRRDGVRLLGPGEQKPLFPTYAWLGVPQNQIYIAKSLLECNYLQALDGDCDSSHLNFLHKIFKPDGAMAFSAMKISHPILKSIRWSSAFESPRSQDRSRQALRATVAIRHAVYRLRSGGPEVDGKLDGFKAVYQVPRMTITLGDTTSFSNGRNL